MLEEVKKSICAVFFLENCKPVYVYGVIESDADKKLQKDLENLEKWSNDWKQYYSTQQNAR